MNKKNLFFSVFVAAIIFFTTGCNDGDVKKIEMTTDVSGKIEIRIVGYGKMTIDWGDGTALETHNLKDCIDGRWFDSNDAAEYIYNHVYSVTSPRTIIITGENITHLRCDNIYLTSLDVSKSTALTFLYCDYNQLTDLDVSKNTVLTELFCGFNQLINLDLSNNTALTELVCNKNKLENLDLSRNTVLVSLQCNSNQLTGLDASNNTRLTRLQCLYNSITLLDLSKNIALTELYCSWNQLTSLNVSGNTAMTRLYCTDNQLDTDALNTLFGTLHSNAVTKEIYIENNPGTNACDRNIAEDKGWNVRY